MTTRPRSSKTKTALDRLRRSRSLASTTLAVTLLSIVGPVIPKTASAQTAATAPSNPGNAGGGQFPLSTGVQQGQPDLGVPETGPSAALQANWSVDPSTGAFGASVPFVLPKARGAVQPSLALVYSSSTGQSVGGVGWSLNLPSIERHNPSGLPHYFDPAVGAAITVGGADAGAPAEDWFTYGGKALVPICAIGVSGSCAPIDVKQNNESMPTWATGGWHYYRLEVESGLNLRFFWSPNHQTWVVQDPSGGTSEFGVPQDTPTDATGTDTDILATAAAATAADGSHIPAVFRWNLVRQYDAQRLPGNVPTNVIQYVWSKLQATSLLGPSTPLPDHSPIADLTDIYDTYPVSSGRPATLAYFAHHTHLTYDTSFSQVGGVTRVDRARHQNYLTNVDVTSQTFQGSWNTGAREQVRRYVLAYKSVGHEVQLSKVLLDGWCATNAPTEDATTSLLPAESASSAPACGVGPMGKTWPPATVFGYSDAGPAPTFTTLPMTFNLRPPTPPAIFDMNADGMPDLVDNSRTPNPLDSSPWNQIAYLNSAPPATAPNTWTAPLLTMSNIGPLNASSPAMNPFSRNFVSAAFTNGGSMNGLWFDPVWTAPYLALTGAKVPGVGMATYSPARAPSSTYDWGNPTAATVASIFPGCRELCFVTSGRGWPAPIHCGAGSMYLGCDRPFGGTDIDGDGLQDLLVSSNYGTCDPNKVRCDGDNYFPATPTFLTTLNAKFSQRSTSGIVTPFAYPPPQMVSTVGSTPGSTNDQPNICLGGVDAGANPLLTQQSTLGDINGDGLPDVIALFADRFFVWYGHGDGVFGSCADGSTECACSDASHQTFVTTGENQWNESWSPLGLNWGDPYLQAQFHDVDGDGYDEAIVPSLVGFDVYFVTTSTGTPSKLHVDLTGAPPNGFGWSLPNVPGTTTWSNGLPTSTKDSDSSYMFADMDGSGVDDVLVENANGQMGYVSLLPGGRPGLLMVVATENGAATTVNYQDLPSLSRAVAGTSDAWNTQSPQPVHAVASVFVQDLTPGLPPSQPGFSVHYRYKDPIYDGRDRQFLGFSSVEVENVGDPTAPSVFAKTTFYQGYCSDSSTAYPCPTTVDYPNHALRGLPILTETYGDQTVDSDGLSRGPALSTIHQSFREMPIYAGMDGRYVHHVDVREVDTFWHDNSAPLVRAPVQGQIADVAPAASVTLQPQVRIAIGAGSKKTTVVYRDIDTWGMSKEIRDLGRVDSTGASIDGEIDYDTNVKPVPQDSLDHWIWRTLSASGNGVHARNYVYDARGNLTRVISPAYSTPAQDMAALRSVGLPIGGSQTGADITLAQYTLDTSQTGNVLHAQQPGTSRCKDIVYDAVYSLLPVSVTTHVGGCGDTGLTSRVLGYAFGLGLVTDSSTADGRETKMHYEPYGRVQSVQRPDPTTPNFTESYAGLQVDYGDTQFPHQIRTTVTDGSANSLTVVRVIDGYGRTVMNVAPGDPSAGDAQPFIVSGRVQWNARGGTSAAYPAAAVSDWGSLVSQAPTGTPRAAQYDAFGRVLAAEDLDSTMTLQRVYGALAYSEKDANQIAYNTLNSGTTTAITLDGHGRQLTVETQRPNANLKTTSAYFPTGELAQVTRTGGDGTNVYNYQRSMQYDSLGRLAVNAEPASPWSYAYDDAGDVVATADARGCGKNLGYDGAGRPVYEDYIGCDPAHPTWTAPDPKTGAGAEIFYKYDGVTGHLTDVYDRAAHTGYRYDYRSRLTNVQRNIVEPNATQAPGTGGGYTPHTFEQTFAYDDLDRLIAQTTGEDGANGAAANLLGTPVPVFPAVSGPADSTSAVTLQYSKRGVLKSVGGSYGALVRQFAYDANGLPLATSWGDAASPTGSYPPGSPALPQWATVQGTQTVYTYDARLRLQERMTSRQALGSWTVPYSPAPGTSRPIGPLTLEADIFAFDLIANPTQITDLRSGSEWPSTAAPVTRTIGSDAFYRTTSVAYSYQGGANTYDSPTPPATATESPLPLKSAATRMATEVSKFDPFGNRTSSTDDTGSFFDRSLGTIVSGLNTNVGFAATSTNQVASATLPGAAGGALKTTYDAAGNLTLLTVLRNGTCETSGGCSHIFQYDWDEIGRLSRARRYDFTFGVTYVFSGGSRHIAWPTLSSRAPVADVTFTYDANGVRVLRASSISTTTPSQPTYTVDVFPSLRLSETTFGVNNGGVDYDRSDATDQVTLLAGGSALGRVAYAPGAPMSSNSPYAGQHVFLEMTDHLGSTTTVIDQATSELVERTTYSAFGRVESDYRPDRWEKFREPFKFTGKEEDVAFGLTYFGARYYSPYLGTWISPDPLAIHALGADLNPYAYVHGQTMSATDAFGLCTESECPNGDGSAWQIVLPFPTPGMVKDIGDAANAVGKWLSGLHFGGGSPTPVAPKNPGNANFPATLFGGGGQSAEDAYQQSKAQFGTTSAVPNPVMDDLINSSQMASAVAAQVVTPLAGPALGAFSVVSDVEQTIIEADAVAGATRAAAAENLAAGSIRGVNPTGGTVNCVACSIATDATLGGSPASAIPGGPFSAADVLAQFPGRSFIPANGYGGIQTMMSNWGAGARGIVWGTRGAEMGHMFNVVNQGGVIRFLDGQVGGAAALEQYDGLYLLRTN